MKRRDTRRRSRPAGIGDALRHVLQRIDPDRRLPAYRVWTFWEEEVGATMAAHAQPAAFRDGVLSVRVDGAAWMQELQFMKEDVRQRLNARLGAELIRDVYFVSGRIERPAPRRPAAPPPTPEALEPPCELPPVTNPELAAVLARLADAARRRGRR